MKVLLVVAHPCPDSFNQACAAAAARGLARAGHTVDTIDLYAVGFRAAMSREERVAYESDHPILDPMVDDHAARLLAADAIVFVYPTWWMGLPAILKGWLDRVLVPGVAFHLDERTNRVRPGLGHIHRIVGITTYGSPRRYVWLMSDGGRRTLLRALRMLAPRGRRTSWIALYGVDTSTADQRAEFVRRVHERMAAL